MSFVKGTTETQTQRKEIKNTSPQRSKEINTNPAKEINRNTNPAKMENGNHEEGSRQWLGLNPGGEDSN